MKTTTVSKVVNLQLKKGNLQKACCLALVGCVENNGDVYLPNAYEYVKEVISPNQWAGYISALAKEGKYKKVDDCFGELLIK